MLSYKFSFNLDHSSSSSIGTATLVGFGLLNYVWVFSAGRFLQNAVASSTSNPQLGRTSDLERSNSRHKVSPTPETKRANPSSGRWNYGREMSDNFAESGDFHVIFWVLLHAVNLRHGTDGFISPTAEEVFRPKNPPGLNPRTRVPEASTLTSRPPKPLNLDQCLPNFFFCTRTPFGFEN